MGHPIHRVERFEIVGPYTLMLQFGDGTHQLIDFRPILEGEVFGALPDLQLFNTVELDPHVRNDSVAEWRGLRPRNPARLATVSRGVRRDGEALVHRYQSWTRTTG